MKYYTPGRTGVELKLQAEGGITGMDIGTGMTGIKALSIPVRISTKMCIKLAL